jgi:hypothetical protein
MSRKFKYIGILENKINWSHFQINLKTRTLDFVIWTESAKEHLFIYTSMYINTAANNVMLQLDLTFIGPCIVMHFHSKTN